MIASWAFSNFEGERLAAILTRGNKKIAVKAGCKQKVIICHNLIRRRNVGWAFNIHDSLVVSHLLRMRKTNFALVVDMRTRSFSCRQGPRCIEKNARRNDGRQKVR